MHPAINKAAIASISKLLSKIAIYKNMVNTEDEPDDSILSSVENLGQDQQENLAQ